MKDKKKIYLSYLKDDCPTYVNKLEKELHYYFGEESVVRDIEDAQAGFTETLDKTAAVLVIIGSEWESIMTRAEGGDGSGNNSDQILSQLIDATERAIPVIAVTINGTKLSDNFDQDFLNWLKKNEQVDLSDTDDRWTTDVFSLVNLLETKQGIERVKHEVVKKEGKGISNKTLFGLLALALIITVLIFRENPNSDTGASGISQQKPAMQVNGIDVPNISGTWKSESGIYYTFSSSSSGTFLVATLGFARGNGSFSDTVPGKFSFKMTGAGQGEYTLAEDGESFTGWFQQSGSNKKVEGTFRREE